MVRRPLAGRDLCRNRNTNLIFSKLSPGFWAGRGSVEQQQQQHPKTHSNRMRTRILLSLVAALCCIVVTVEVHGQGTAFSYSGQLTENGRPANGPYNLRFAVFDTASGGIQLGP